ncbi:MAG: molybdenum cofactor guanylyltransferase [Pseudomonadota bacterium]
MAVKTSVGVVLAGGRSRRMGRTKATLTVGGERLIDRQLSRLRGMVDQIAVSGRENFGLSLPVIADRLGVEGPVAGILGVADWLGAQQQAAAGFLTVPVDTPFLPLDLAERLMAEPNQSAIAADEVGVHATCAYWALDALGEVEASSSPSPSLRAIAEMAGARTERWPSDQHFFNINTPADLALAEARQAGAVSAN